MNTFLKIATATALTGALALAAATPSEARNGRNAAAIGGFAVGAVVGAAAASAANRNYYGGPGYYDSGYAHGPGYAYEPAPTYAYEAAPTYVQDDSYAYAPRSCWKVTDDTRGFGYYGSCATPQYRSGARRPRNEAQ